MRKYSKRHHLKIILLLKSISKIMNYFENLKKLSFIWKIHVFGSKPFVKRRSEPVMPDSTYNSGSAMLLLTIWK